MITLSWEGLGGQLRVVQLDAYTSEGHEDTVTVTDHPVETGVVITDHARDQPKQVFLEGVVSNVPMPGKDGVQSGPIDLSFELQPTPGTRTIRLDVARPPPEPSVRGLVVEAARGIATLGIDLRPRATVWGEFERRRQRVRATVLQYGTPQNRPQAVDQALLEAIALKARITVTTELRTVGNLQITRLHPSRSVDGGKKYLFQIDLRQIRVVNSLTVEAPVPVEARGAVGKNAGAQSTTPRNGDTAEESAKLESTLSRLF